MPDVHLHFTTGDDTIDRVMRGYIAAFEAAFPGRVRAFTIAGGYAEGTATTPAHASYPGPPPPSAASSSPATPTCSTPSIRSPLFRSSSSVTKPARP